MSWLEKNCTASEIIRQSVNLFKNLSLPVVCHA